MVAHLIHLDASGPIGRSVLALAVVYSALFAIAALMVALAVWRANGSGASSHGPELPYVVDRVGVMIGHGQS